MIVNAKGSALDTSTRSDITGLSKGAGTAAVSVFRSSMCGFVCPFQPTQAEKFRCEVDNGCGRSSGGSSGGSSSGGFGGILSRFIPSSSSSSPSSSPSSSSPSDPSDYGDYAPSAPSASSSSDYGDYGEFNGPQQSEAGSNFGK